MSAPTVRDVARHAGVSPKTVSNVLNGFARVAPQTRSRVERAVAELGYRPNRAARALRTRRSRTIGLVVASITNPYYPELVRGAQDIADGRGHAVIVGNSDAKPARERAFLELLVEQRVDGIIFQSRRPLPDDLALVLHTGIPLVLIGGGPAADCDRVWTDDENGAYLATRHLLALGHRRVAHLAGSASVTLGVNRRHGWARALAEAGIAPDPSLLVETDLDRASGRWATAQLLDSGVDVTAIFAANDLLAFGALEALRRVGRRVPDDVSLVGFDDVAEAADVDPPLTTVTNQAARLGACAAELLFDRIDGHAGPRREVALPTALVERASTRRIAASVAATPA